jgi:hypothetical protein
LGIVLPPVSLATLAAVHVSIGVSVYVSVEIILVVDVDIAPAMPVAIAPSAAGPGTQRKSGRAPRQSHPRVVPRIGVRVIGISGRRRSVHNRRIVRRNIDYVGLSGLHYNNLFPAFYRLGLDFLLRSRL